RKPNKDRERDRERDVRGRKKKEKEKEKGKQKDKKRDLRRDKDKDRVERSQGGLKAIVGLGLLGVGSASRSSEKERDRQGSISAGGNGGRSSPARKRSSSTFGTKSAPAGVDNPLDPPVIEKDVGAEEPTQVSKRQDYYKAYGTLSPTSSTTSSASSSSKRERAPPRTRSSSLFKRLLPGRGNSSSGSSSGSTTSATGVGVGSTGSGIGGGGGSTGSIGGAYNPPWLTLPTREQQEMQKKAMDAMGSLTLSFEGVGLLPSLKEKEKEREREREKELKGRRRVLGSAPANFGSTDDRERDKDRRENDILSNVPAECLFMLLPLWPGETDPVSARHFPYEMPQVSLEERRFLLVYYKPIEREMLEVPSTSSLGSELTGVGGGRGGGVQPVQTRKQSVIMDKRNILLPGFLVLARQVTFADLRGSGVRVPDDGMAISGPLEEAHQTAPSFLQTQHHGKRECMLGSCYSREAGIEFDPEALIELGLCKVLKEETLPLPPGMMEEELERSVEVKLTAVGSAVVEMVWIGGLAVTSFAPVPL
ncbi:hypothetical protein VNI00_017609, partial [Paramarasmius palmivorus]